MLRRFRSRIVIVGVVSPEFGASKIVAADLEGDGNMDVLTSWSEDGWFAWYENLNGLGNFGQRRTFDGLSTQLSAEHGLVAANLDGDGDVDVATMWYWFDTVEGQGLFDVDWWENTHDDCNANDVPDECDDPQVILECTDVDRDGVSAAIDCDDSLDDVWTAPGSIAALLLERAGMLATLGWQPPVSPGATDVRYDVLRSSFAHDFVVTAFCMEQDETDLVAEDHDVPVPGELFFYLIRVENDCPGSPGALGVNSEGTPRVGLLCF